MDYTELEVKKILWHTLCEILGTPLLVVHAEWRGRGSAGTVARGAAKHARQPCS